MGQEFSGSGSEGCDFHRKLLICRFAGYWIYFCKQSTLANNTDPDYLFLQHHEIVWKGRLG